MSAARTSRHRSVLPPRQQFIPAVAPALQRPQHRQDLRVGQLAGLAHAGLRHEVERRAVPPDRHVLLAERREAERAVLRRVVLGADAEEAAIEHAHAAREHALPRQAGALEVGAHAPAEGRQTLGEPLDPLELPAVPPPPPLRVVQVLAPAGIVRAGRLQVPGLVGADPHVGPGRRDRQAADAGEHLGVAHAAAVGVHVGEPAPLPAARHAGRGAGDPSQASHLVATASGPRARARAVPCPSATGPGCRAPSPRCRAAPSFGRPGRCATEARRGVPTRCRPASSGSPSSPRRRAPAPC